MKHLINITLVFTLIICSSCNDITSNIDKYNKEFLKKTILNKDDSLQFISKDTIDFGTIRKNNPKTTDLVLTNNSESISIIIYDLKPEGLKIIIPNIPNPLPITIKPKQTNINAPISLFLDTYGLDIGTYYGKIYFNESKIFFLPVKVTIIE
jgi:hypothetical protein